MGEQILTSTEQRSARRVPPPTLVAVCLLLVVLPAGVAFAAADGAWGAPCTLGETVRRDGHRDVRSVRGPMYRLAGAVATFARAHLGAMPAVCIPRMALPSAPAASEGFDRPVRPADSPRAALLNLPPPVNG